MTGDDPLLLRELLPVVRMDSREPFGLRSAELGPGDELRRADGTLIAQWPELSLAFLGRRTYGNGEKAARGDTIGHSGRDYRAAAQREEREHPERMGVVYGRLAVDEGVRWAQFWMWFPYNAVVPVGAHEGDWEMVMVEVDGGDRRRVVFSQHAHAAVLPWSGVKREGGRLVVFVALGTHALYPSAGRHWTGVAFDLVDGGRRVVPSLEAFGPWAECPVSWGDTRARRRVESNSPGPLGARKAWRRPTAWALTARSHG